MRDWREARGNEREGKRKAARGNGRACMHVHALACTHGRHACTQTERVLRCENRRAKSSQWRAEAGIGGVTHVVNERPIRAPSPVDFELVSRSVHCVCVHARERRTREGKREREGKKQESARASKERATNSRKKKRERLTMA